MLVVLSSSNMLSLNERAKAPAPGGVIGNGRKGTNGLVIYSGNRLTGIFTPTDSAAITPAWYNLENVEATAILGSITSPPA